MKNVTFLFFFVLLASSCEINNYYECDCCENRIGDDVIISENQIILQPGAEKGKDAFIENYPYDDYVNKNFGTNVEFIANAWTAYGTALVMRSLIEFDLSIVPKNKKVKSAKLYLYAAESEPYHIGHSTRSGSNEFVIQRITSEWDEMEVTWNNRPGTTDFAQVVVAGSSSVLQDYEIVITKIIKDILDNPSQGHGLLIKLVAEEYYRRVLFASSDYKDSSKHPKLVLEFE